MIGECIHADIAQDDKFESSGNYFNNASYRKPEPISTQPICFIKAKSPVFNIMDPENTSGSSSGSGTGFVVDMPYSDKLYIITCHHVIANASKVLIHFCQVTEHFVSADIIGCNPNLDVAILSIDNAVEFRNMSKLVAGSSDNLSLPLRVNSCGFAQGNSFLQMTEGVMGARLDNRLQHDVASNGGNSGGPLICINTKQVVGMVTSGQPDAQGINYAAPITEIMLFMQRCLNYIKTYRSLNSKILYIERSLRIPATLAKVTPALFYKYTTKKDAKLTELPTGLLVTYVGNTLSWKQDDSLLKKWGIDAEIDGMMTKYRWRSCLKKYNLPNEKLAQLKNDTLLVNDLVTGMIVNGDYFEIDQHGNCVFTFSRNMQLPFTSIFNRLSPSSKVQLVVKRLVGNTVQDLRQEITLQENNSRFREYFPDIEFIPYVTYGGIVVMTLSLNHIQAIGNKMLYHVINTPEKLDTSIILITQIKPDSPFGDTDTIIPGDVIEYVNDKKIQTLEEYANAWGKFLKDAPANGLFTIRTRDGGVAAAVKQNIINAKNIIGNASFNR